MRKSWRILVIAWCALLIPMRVNAAGAVEHFSADMSYQEVAQAALELQEQAAAASVRTAGHNVRVDNYSDPDENGLIYKSRGSGVIMKADGNMVYIVTAAHCLKHDHTLVEFADGSEHLAFPAYCNADKDVGFLLVPYTDLAPETILSILPAAGADAAAIAGKAGDLLFAVSSSDGPNALILPGILDELSVDYPNNPGQRVLQFYSMASFGSSGGGLYTMSGIWLGNVSGGNTYGKCWAVPYGDIMAEYQVWLEQLAREAAQSAGSAQQPESAQPVGSAQEAVPSPEAAQLPVSAQPAGSAQGAEQLPAPL